MSAPDPADPELHADAYDGLAVVSAAGASGEEPAGSAAPRLTPDPEGRTTPSEVEVEVRLRGHFEPLDGRFHWYGRLAAHEAVRAWQPGATVVVTTPRGSAAGRLSDLDPWGRFRVSGTGRPPF